jgi:cytochrome c oxidase accessory protein FixG
MLDEHSLTVTYNDWRGEPRSRHAKKAALENKPVGDCVDCNACVVVCPMGIDIRDGQQLECITCALCIDACDDVMDRLGKERGLISYATLADHQYNMAIATGSGKVVQPARIRDRLTGRLVDAIRLTNWRSIVRPRTIVYFIGWTAIGLGMLTALALRSPLSLSVLHDRNPLFVTMRDGSISNGYDLKVLNMTPEPRTVTISIAGLEGATLAVNDHPALTPTSLEVELDPDKVMSLRAFVQVPAAQLPQTQARFIVAVTSPDGAIRTQAETTFEVPETK